MGLIPAVVQIEQQHMSIIIQICIRRNYLKLLLVHTKISFPKTNLFFVCSVWERDPVHVHGQLSHQRGERLRPPQHRGHVLPTRWGG